MADPIDKGDQTPKTLTGDPIVEEARKNFDMVAEFEGEARERLIDDIKFAWGDSDNGYQWPNAVRRGRDVDNRPCLTMNLIRQHNKQISNEARQNKSSIKIIGRGGGASQASANIMKSLVRHIEFISNAQDTYTLARQFQIDGGLGFWRLVTDYEAPDTFDQEIYIRPVDDPLSVYLDMDIKQKDGSDARYALVFDDVPKEAFREAYPKFQGALSNQPLGIGSADDDWLGRDHVRVCEYFKKVFDDDLLVSFVYQGVRRNVLKSRLTKEMFEAIADHPLTKTRETQSEQIKWWLIVGQQQVDKTDWLGKYIPLVRVVGEEAIIEGKLDRKGHTRNMKDAQRMYNYNASAQVEFVALQGKTPWIAPAKAIEELETMWNTANTANHSVLIYNHIDDQNPDKPIPAPQRTEPPNAAPGYQAGMETAFNQMMMVSGQYQNQLGMMGNERTGKAIGKRQEQSDTATFHFQDNYESALIFTGKQIIDLIPKVYDTKRTKLILADDDSEMEIMLDPGAAQAMQVTQASTSGAIEKVIFNPNVGKYEVAPVVGPAYGSRREETVEALTLILTQAPALTGIIGDLLLSSMDFDKAQEAAQRLRRMVPKEALGQGPSQQEQQLGMQIQALTAALSKSLQRQGKDQLKLVGKDQMRDIDVYEAETKRMQALKDMLPMDEEGLRALIAQLVQESLQNGNSLGRIIESNANDIDETASGRIGQDDEAADLGDESPPVGGARKAPDGQWYLEDPSRKGKYLRLEPLATKRGPSGHEMPDAGTAALLAHHGAKPEEAQKGKDGRWYVPDPARPGKFLRLET